jgi:hypothetical protein
VQPETKFFDPE